MKERAPHVVHVQTRGTMMCWRREAVKMKQTARTKASDGGKDVKISAEAKGRLG